MAEIKLTDEMKAAVRKRMGVADGVELDPWMEAAVEDVLALAEPQIRSAVIQERFGKVVALLRRLRPIRVRVTIPDHFIATFYDDLADALGVRRDLQGVVTAPNPTGGES